jgi:hypothetical protein
MPRSNFPEFILILSLLELFNPDFMLRYTFKCIVKNSNMLMDLLVFWSCFRQLAAVGLSLGAGALYLFIYLL